MTKRQIKPRPVEDWTHINLNFNSDMNHRNRDCKICSDFEDELYNMEFV